MGICIFTNQAFFIIGALSCFMPETLLERVREMEHPVLQLLQHVHRRKCKCLRQSTRDQMQRDGSFQAVSLSTGTESVNL